VTKVEEGIAGIRFLLLGPSAGSHKAYNCFMTFDSEKIEEKSPCTFFFNTCIFSRVESVDRKIPKDLRG